MPELPKFSDFLHCVNTGFKALTANGPVELRLSDVRELDRGQRPDEFPTPMALTFRGPENIILNQDTYALEHPDLGRHSLFLTPIAPDGASPRYEAMIA